MTEVSNTAAAVSGRIPWNKGKITGAKPPLKREAAGQFLARVQRLRRAADRAPDGS